MDNVSILPPGSIGRQFIPPEFLPPGQDEYHFRNIQAPHPAGRFRHLRSDEVERLVKNSNDCDNWDQLLVTDEFDPGQIKNSKFFGLVRIGRLRNMILEHHDFRVPTGITNSSIVSCDIGDHVAIHGVRYLAYYIIGDRCILTNIDEMNTSNHAKFGNGILKEGEPEKIRVWLDLMNETGCRQVLPFDGMIPADAYLWAKYRDDRPLLEQLKQITQNSFDHRRGYYGMVADQCVIKNSRILKDVKIGPHCYIKGANKLKNLTIHSSPDEPTQIGEGVELVNGIIGCGCHIFYGCKAVRFILGQNSNLKYGARLIHSFLGDNSTVSCCEILNNLVFPAHEQHHNNSFLVASLVLGQSNMAAGATIGSNHNSRANDNEIQAGRGFWPGLCTSVKHSCRFASFTLLSKADYPAELNIPLPFSLLSNNASRDQLEVTPAFWWLYNMYALIRNSWKFADRDKRLNKIQNIEFDFLAPDTVEEILSARQLLQRWTAQALGRIDPQIQAPTGEECTRLGEKLLRESDPRLKTLEVLGENMEKSRRKVVIQKCQPAYRAYEDMLYYYAVNNLIAWLQAHPGAKFHDLSAALKNQRQTQWVNLGGQLIPAPDVDQLRSDIRTGKLSAWPDIHNRYEDLWKNYPLEKQKHAWATLTLLLDVAEPSLPQWHSALDRSLTIQQYICDQVYISRKKDYDNPFRQATYRNQEEMIAALGTIDDNSFVKQVRQETEQYHRTIGEIRQRG
ncbi:MAG TPA: DUF4954 family protein [candidate division Zixibacteria bacterium]|nr:DUF4954 family protein [candidate division Zixibacteria bacterium]